MKKKTNFGDFTIYMPQILNEYHTAKSKSIIMKFMKYAIIFITTFFLIQNVNAYSKSIVDITKLSITEINNYIDHGYLTYEELMQLYLDRIEVYDNQYNSLISVNENALEEARKCDEIYQKEGRKSIIFGIPVVLKDNIDYINLPTTGGTRALRDSYPYENAEIVQNLIDNGAIILAKANMSEFAFSANDSYSSYGHVRNAYNIDYTPYGSSGGSAVAVAASFAPISIGTDTNSSVRLPASANNVVGLRPSQGLLSNYGIIAYDITRDTAGPISKTVEDNAILLTILANNGIDYTESLKKDGLQGKKIGVLTQFIKRDSSSNLRVLNYYDPEIEALMNNAIQKMKDAGAIIINIDDFYNYKMESYHNKTIYGRTMCYQFNNYIKNTSSHIKSFNQLINDGGYVQNLRYYEVSCYTDLLNYSYYKQIKEYRSEFRNIVENKMKEYNVDVLIYPTAKNKTIKINNLGNNRVVSPSYSISPTSGLPSISVPMGFASDELPYGFEILAGKNNEELLYEIAYSYEQLDNNIETPPVAPSLYETPDVLLELKEVYENNTLTSSDNYFVEITNKVEDVLFNYKEYEGSSEDIKIILDEYKLQIEKAKLNQNYNADNNSTLINILIIVITIFVINLIAYIIFRKRMEQV